MDPQEYPTRHFELMRELTAALGALPAQVLVHEYTYESFGSWFLTFKYKGLPLRLIFDGRDRRFILQRSNTKNAPYAWSRAIWEKDGAASDSFPLAEFIGVMAEAGKLPKS